MCRLMTRDGETITSWEVIPSNDQHDGHWIVNFHDPEAMFPKSQSFERMFAKKAVGPNVLRCPYCGKGTHKMPASMIYGRGYSGYLFVCDNFPRCDSYVGCHRDTGKPLGTLANRELRKYRQQAHKVFDRMWQMGTVNRDDAYGWMCRLLGVTMEEAHISMLNIEQCQKIIDALSNKPKTATSQEKPDDA